MGIRAVLVLGQTRRQTRFGKDHAAIHDGALRRRSMTEQDLRRGRHVRHRMSSGSFATAAHAAIVRSTASSISSKEGQERIDRGRSRTGRSQTEQFLHLASPRRSRSRMFGCRGTRARGEVIEFRRVARGQTGWEASFRTGWGQSRFRNLGRDRVHPEVALFHVGRCEFEMVVAHREAECVREQTFAIGNVGELCDP